MTINSFKDDNYYIVELAGELDAMSSVSLDAVVETAIAEGYKNLLIDFKNLDYISSPGIGVFTSRIEEVENLQLQLIIFGMSDKILGIFKILGLDQLLNIQDTLEDAKRAIR